MLRKTEEVSEVVSDLDLASPDFGELRVTVLGCGTSTGVPQVGCDCAVCTSPEPKNKRRRSGLHVAWQDAEGAWRGLLVDTSQDLRAQCLSFNIRRVDAVLYTHAHADHIYGLDDLRVFNFIQGVEIPCFGSAETLGGLRQTFPYVFDGQAPEGGGKPRLRLIEVAAEQTPEFQASGLAIRAIPVWHGSMPVYGYRMGDFAYVTDVNHIPEASLEALRGTRVLILGALRYRPHPTHFSFDQAIEMAARIGAERTYLTHMSHDVDYNAPAMELPPGVEPAYDGLSFSI